MFFFLLPSFNIVVMLAMYSTDLAAKQATLIWRKEKKN